MLIAKAILHTSISEGNFIYLFFNEVYFNLDFEDGECKVPGFKSQNSTNASY